MTKPFLFLSVVLVLVSSTYAQESTSKRRNINIARSATARNLPFSDAVLVGNTLYLSGRLGIDPKTGVPPADINDEIKFLLDGFKSVLADANMTMDNLVQVQVFCPDLGLYDKFNAAYRTYFSKDFPARAFIGSGPLLRGAHFEMIGIAAKE
ncbi:MAG: RidA family protein [Ignavibacteriales bacterium]|nr:RidA family protein [Ignavibacteriales bacterium]